MAPSTGGLPESTVTSASLGPTSAPWVASRAPRARSQHCSALFFPCSYFKRSFPAQSLSRGSTGCISTLLLKDNAQMGASVGGPGWQPG